MFGPDICGYSTKKVQAIFNYNGENLARSSDVKSPDDEYTHSYVLIVNKDSTYEIRVDGEEKAKGDMKEDFPFEKPKEIKDPDQSKPEDWVDAEKIDDPEDVKPADWDDEPASIPDPDATKPDDWDDEEDGVWQVKSGTVFSDFILTDSLAEAEAFLEERKTNQDDEKAAKEAYDEAKKAEEAEEEDTEEEDATLEDAEEDKDEL